MVTKNVCIQQTDMWSELKTNRTFSEGYSAEIIDLHDTSVSADAGLQSWPPWANTSIVDEYVHSPMKVDSSFGLVWQTGAIT